MPYTNFTTNYQIPWMAAGEKSSGQSNRRAALIIDAQLCASQALLGNNGVLQEGTYSSTFATGNSMVSLLATGYNWALQGIIAGVYIEQNTTLTWTGLPDNSTIYLYARTEESNLFTSNEFSSLQNRTAKTTFNTTGTTPLNSILLGVATTTSSDITLNTSVTAADTGTFSTGKVYIRPIEEIQSSVDSLSVAVPNLVSQVSGLRSTLDSVSGVTLQLSGVSQTLLTETSSLSATLDSVSGVTCSLVGVTSGLQSEIIALGPVLHYSVVAQTADYTASIGDVVICDTTSVGFTVTLPIVSGISTPFPIVVKKVSSDSNIVTVSSSDGIDDVMTLGLSGLGDKITVISGSTKWYSI